MQAIYYNNVNYNKDLIKEKLYSGFQLLGGFEKYFEKKDKILLKPNILAGDVPEKATTTHPVFLAAVVEFFLENEMNITIGESPAMSQLEKAAKTCGIWQIASEYGVDFIELDKPKVFTNKKNPFIKSFEFSERINYFNKIISLPKIKSHGFTNYTGAMKNLFGLVPGRIKAQWHVRLPKPENFSKMICDLNDTIPQTISIMDGILCQEGNGPRGGNPIELNSLIIGENPFITDLVAINLIGLNIKNAYIVKEYVEKHKLSSDIKDYNIMGDDILKKQFKFPQKKGSLTRMLSISENRIIKYLFSPRPVINAKKCKKCGICYESCPLENKAISFEKYYIPKYNYSKCIRCFCCQELCPYDAIDIKYPILAKIMRKI